MNLLIPITIYGIYQILLSEPPCRTVVIFEYFIQILTALFLICDLFEKIENPFKFRDFLWYIFQMQDQIITYSGSCINRDKFFFNLERSNKVLLHYLKFFLKK